MSDPEGARVVRQLRHDVDDVDELLSDVAETQRAHSGELAVVRQALQGQGDRLDRFGGRLGGIGGRLDGIEDVQRQILELLRDGRPGR